MSFSGRIKVRGMSRTQVSRSIRVKSRVSIRARTRARYRVRVRVSGGIKMKIWVPYS